MQHADRALLQGRHVMQAIQSFVRQSMAYIPQTPDKETRIELIKTLQTVTEGKVSCLSQPLLQHADLSFIRGAILWGFTHCVHIHLTVAVFSADDAFLWLTVRVTARDSHPLLAPFQTQPPAKAHLRGAARSAGVQIFMKVERTTPFANAQAGGAAKSGWRADLCGD